MKVLKKLLGGTGCGFINALFGAGGGMIAVPVLSKLGLERHKAHSTSVAVIMPLSIISALMYINTGNVAVKDVYPFLPAGILGALTGTWLLTKLDENLLRKIFATFMVFAGMRLLLK